MTQYEERIVNRNFLQYVKGLLIRWKIYRHYEKNRRIARRQGAIIGEGVKHIGYALARNTTLKNLNLYCNCIGCKVLQSIVEALRENNTLTHLNLGYGIINDDGAKALAESLKINSSLKVIDLSDNKIGDDGAKYLAEGTETLELLNLTKNNISDELQETLASSVIHFDLTQLEE